MSEIVSANEAAHRFGLSEKTVRRWIAAGKLKADKHGRAYRVDLSKVAVLIGHDTAHDGGPSTDSGRTADAGSAPPTTDSTSAMFGIAELVALVDRLQAEARAHAEAAAVWQERCRVLTEQLALSAPAAARQPQEPPLDTSTATQATNVPMAPLRSWWRSWWLLAIVAGVALLGVLVVALVPW